jgi:hypothetical protein
MERKFFVIIVLAIAVVFMFISSAEAVLDLVNNPRLYQYSQHKAAKNFHSSLQIKVVEDKRPEMERVKHEEAPYYVYDGLWSDFVEGIVSTVLAKEFANAGMFDTVDVHSENSRYLLVMELYSFAGRIEEPPGLKPVYHFFGSVDLQVKLISRNNGKELFTKRYKERSKSVVNQFRVRDKYVNGAIELGKSFQTAAVRIMKDVETALSGGRVSPY